MFTDSVVLMVTSLKRSIRFRRQRPQFSERSDDQLLAGGTFHLDYQVFSWSLPQPRYGRSEERRGVASRSLF